MRRFEYKSLYGAKDYALNKHGAEGWRVITASSTPNGYFYQYLMERELEETSKPMPDSPHAMDCALHNVPAMRPGRCNCGVNDPQAEARYTAAMEKFLDSLGGCLLSRE